MATVAEPARPDRVRYRFPPLERRGVIAGWRGGQIASVAVSLVFAVLALRSRPSVGGIILALVSVAVGVALVIFTAVTHQLGSVSRALGLRPFQYVGKISYGAYLWHFPLFAMLSATSLHLVGYPLLVIRIGVTLLVATLSFYVVEEPIRRGRMRSLTEWRAWLMTSGAVFGEIGRAHV